MDEAEAISYLRNHCWFDPPLTIPQAKALWDEYHQKVIALPERRNIPAPTTAAIPGAHQSLVRNFLSRHRGPEVTGVINVDPKGLVVYQLYVVTERADAHALDATSWPEKTLVIDRPATQMPIRQEDDALKINLPHAEHMVGVQPDGAFRFLQGGGFVSVVSVASRMLLKAGYHRSFAFSRAVMNEPEAKDRCELAAVTVSLPPPLMPTFPHQGLRTTVLGSRPPLFADFFDVDLAMSVRLRKKRWEAHIKIVAVDDV
jgi:hypothetical protein